jgi:hypothetical protein
MQSSLQRVYFLSINEQYSLIKEAKIIKIILALRISVRGNSYPSLTDGITRHYIRTTYYIETGAHIRGGLGGGARNPP